jgi:hypothetical protein
VPRAVDVFDEEHATGVDARRDALERLRRIGKVSEQETCVHDIESLPVRRRLQGVVDTEVHVVDPGLRGLGPGELDLRRIEVRADDESVRRDLSELTRHVSTTTTKVETAGGRLDSDSGEQGAGGRPHHTGEHPEPLSALQAPADHVRRRAHALTPRSRPVDRSIRPSRPRRSTVRRSAPTTGSVSGRIRHGLIAAAIGSNAYVCCRHAYVHGPT